MDPKYEIAALAAEFIATEFTHEDASEARLRAVRQARVADGLPADPVFATNGEFYAYVDKIAAPVRRIRDDQRVPMLLAVAGFLSAGGAHLAVPGFLQTASARCSPEQLTELRAKLPAGAMIPLPRVILIPRVPFEA